MSRQLPGEQVEHAFNAKRLNNWQTPLEDANVVSALQQPSHAGMPCHHPRRADQPRPAVLRPLRPTSLCRMRLDMFSTAREGVVACLAAVPDPDATVGVTYSLAPKPLAVAPCLLCRP